MFQFNSLDCGGLQFQLYVVSFQLIFFLVNLHRKKSNVIDMLSTVRNLQYFITSSNSADTNIMEADIDLQRRTWKGDSKG